MNQFVLKDGEEAGIYPGLGVAEHGKPLTAYGEEQLEAFKADKRFKVYHAPKEDAPAEVSTSEADSTAQRPAKTGKDGK